jgi:hypothetical protein
MAVIDEKYPVLPRLAPFIKSHTSLLTLQSGINAASKN